MSNSATFERDPRSAKHARHFVTDQLHGHESALVGDVVLMVSELVTNSILHTSGELTLTVEVDTRTIRVAVTDAGPGTPSIQSPQPEEPNGRGLALVARLSDEWGTGTNDDGGNTVWFSVHIDQHALRHQSHQEAAPLRSPTRPNPGSHIGPQGPTNRSPDRQPPTAMALGRPLIMHSTGVSRRRCAAAGRARQRAAGHRC